MSTPSGDGPCKIDVRGSVTPCVGLEASTDSLYARGRGLQRISLISHLGKDAETIRHTYALKAGEYAKKGVLLNYCPFCGCDIRKPRTSVPREDGEEREPDTTAKELS